MFQNMHLQYQVVYFNSQMQLITITRLTIRLDSKKIFIKKRLQIIGGRPQRIHFKTLFRMRWIQFMQARFIL